MATATQLRSRYPKSAQRHYLLSQLVAERATTQAAAANSTAARLAIITSSQIAQATLSTTAVAEMLAEQDIASRPDATLTPSAFTTDSAAMRDMLNQTEADWQFRRLVASLVQGAGRAAESVSTAVRPGIAHVRFLSPPSCSRCAILAGRVYRWSDGFQRHPHCDCTMVPTAIANATPQDVDQLVRDGMVSGLSKADRRALSDGADLGQVVNVRSKKAGLVQSGSVLSRAGRPTPEAIYRTATNREQAVELLTRHGYVR